ncbi:hypothetical protein BZL30_4671 [Mycobacterium kansasii]|uniref:Uncharacterized protein n=1 Tax=Mycobacterium kansasii TaxID=1768 RepID=A0A1V3X2M5_MYCKA|nr:hypothetical protein BZL30_4671 [Mycobacterium kansasii]
MLAGNVIGTPKLADGPIAAIRMLRVARSGRSRPAPPR